LRVVGITPSANYNTVERFLNQSEIGPNWCVKNKSRI